MPDAVPALEALFVRAVHQGLQKLCGNQPVTSTNIASMACGRPRFDFHTGCTCPNCFRPSPIGGGMEKCPELCAGNLITSPYAKQCCQCAQEA